MRYRLTHLFIPLVVIALAAAPVFAADAGNQDIACGKSPSAAANAPASVIRAPDAVTIGDALAGLTEQAASAGELAEQAASEASELAENTPNETGELAGRATADTGATDPQKGSSIYEAGTKSDRAKKGDGAEQGPETEGAEDKGDAADAEDDAVSGDRADEEVTETLADDLGLKLISVGKGELITSEDGSLECVPSDGYEVVSIRADKDAEEIKKGREIPEEEISDMTFEENTTITAVFRKNPEEQMPTARPASAGAAFGS